MKNSFSQKLTYTINLKHRWKSLYTVIGEPFNILNGLTWIVVNESGHACFFFLITFQSCMVSSELMANIVIWHACISLTRSGKSHSLSSILGSKLYVIYPKLSFWTLTLTLISLFLQNTTHKLRQKPTFSPKRFHRLLKETVLSSKMDTFNNILQLPVVSIQRHTFWCYLS